MGPKQDLVLDMGAYRYMPIAQPLITDIIERLLELPNRLYQVWYACDHDVGTSIPLTLLNRFQVLLTLLQLSFASIDVLLLARLHAAYA